MLSTRFGDPIFSGDSKSATMGDLFFLFLDKPWSYRYVLNMFDRPLIDTVEIIFLTYFTPPILQSSAFYFQTDIHHRSDSHIFLPINVGPRRGCF